MFNWTYNISIPKVTDVINTSHFPMNFMQIFTYIWVWFMGGWFFAGVIGVIGGALYIKTNNVLSTVAFYIIMVVLLTPVLRATGTTIISAEGFIYMVGLIVGVAIGFSIYKLMIYNKGG